MGFLNPNQRNRLLRESPWPDAQALAEELYAIAGDIEPQVFPNGIVLPVTPGIAPLQLEDFSGDIGQPIINIHHLTGPDTPLSAPDLQPEPPDEASDDGAIPENAWNTTAYPGLVLSGGPEQYEVSVYTRGTDQAPSSKQVAQVGFATMVNGDGATVADPGDIVPAGTWTTVFRVDHIIRMDNPKFNFAKPPSSRNPKYITRTESYAIMHAADVGSGTFAAQITGGTGDTYTADVYINGRSKAPVTKTVKQLEIDDAETIPAGTWALVARQKDGEYLIQVAVWL